MKVVLNPTHFTVISGNSPDCIQPSVCERAIRILLLLHNVLAWNSKRENPREFPDGNFQRFRLRFNVRSLLLSFTSFTSSSFALQTRS